MTKCNYFQSLFKLFWWEAIKQYLIEYFTSQSSDKHCILLCRQYTNIKQIWKKLWNFFFFYRGYGTKCLVSKFCNFLIKLIIPLYTIPSHNFSAPCGRWRWNKCWKPASCPLYRWHRCDERKSYAPHHSADFGWGTFAPGNYRPLQNPPLVLKVRERNRQEWSQ